MALPSFLKKIISKPAPSRPRAKRDFLAGGTGRLVEDWSGSDVSLNDMFTAQVARLRNRARNLERNSPITRRFLSIATTNVVGPEGFRLRSKPMDRPGSVDEGAKNLIESAWADFSKIRNFTIQKRQSRVEVEEMIIRRLLIDGEIFIRKYPGRPNEHGYAVDLIPAEVCDDTLNRTAGSGRNAITHGIEVDGENVPVAYWMFSNPDAAAPGRKHIRIPADQIIHIYKVERPWQVRGITWCAAPMWRQKMLDAYEESILVGARAAANHLGFFTGEKPTFDGEYADGSQVMDSEAGTMHWMGGEETQFNAFEPDYPPAEYTAFMKQGLRILASGYGVSYENLSNDRSDVNYSSIRQGELQDREMWKCLQRFLRERFHEEIFPEWLLWSMTMGKITLPLQKYSKFNSATWHARGWAWIDPLKEIQAAEKAHALGVLPLEIIASDRGMDLEELFQMYAREDQLADKYNLNLTPTSIEAPDGPETTDQTD